MTPETKGQLLAALPRLRRFTRALTGNGHDADDLVQTVCERAIRQIAQFTPGTRMESWLFRIAQTAWIDHARARRVRVDHASAVLATAEEAAGGEHEAVDRVHIQRVDAALGSLPEEQRAVLALVCVEELSYAEAAQVLGIPVGTVMSRLSRGRLALRQLVESGVGRT